jgi:hypothetical protein
LDIDFDKGIARIPGLVLVLGLVGTVVAARMGGLPYAGAFFIGAGAAYFNFRLLERFVNRLGELARLAETAAKTGPAKPVKASGALVFIQFALFVLAGFVILRLSGFNVVVALCGFLVCPAAVMLEILYELLNYGHS